MECLINSAEEIDCTEWNEIVMLASGNPVQLYEYSLIPRSKSKGIFVRIRENHNTIFAWLVYYIGTSKFGYIKADSEPISSNFDLVKIAIRNLQSRFHPFKFDFYSITLSRFANEELFNELNFECVYRYATTLIDLKQEESQIFNGVHSKHRNVIRKAQREGVIFYEDSSLHGIENYYLVSQKTYARSNMKGIEKELLINYFQTLYKCGHCRIFFSSYQEKIQAAAFILLSPSKAIYWHGASIDKPMSGAANMLHWEIIRKFKSENIALYDLGGISLNAPEKSKAWGITLFKKRFGGQEFLHYGGVLILNKRKNQIFNIYRSLKQKIYEH